MREIGAPGEIRTPGLLIRSQMLYPAELRARVALHKRFFAQTQAPNAGSRPHQDRQIPAITTTDAEKMKAIVTTALRFSKVP